MNKSELSSALAAKVGITNAAASEIVSALFDGEDGILAQTLATGGDVALQGFGTFKVKARAARVATNPATGGKVNVPAKNVASFKPGKNLVATVAN
jgi:DNA-binding protein HU-beta